MSDFALNKRDVNQLKNLSSITMVKGLVQYRFVKLNVTYCRYFLYTWILYHPDIVGDEASKVSDLMKRLLSLSRCGMFFCRTKALDLIVKIWLISGLRLNTISWSVF